MGVRLTLCSVSALQKSAEVGRTEKAVHVKDGIFYVGSAGGAHDDYSAVRDCRYVERLLLTWTKSRKEVRVDLREIYSIPLSYELHQDSLPFL